MSDLSVTNTFVPLTTIVSGQVNTNFSDIVNYINNRDDGTATWDNMNVTATVANPVTIKSNQSTTEVAIDNTATTGDPLVSYKLTGTAQFSHGVDDSVSGDPWVLSVGAALGTTDAIVVTSARAVSIFGTATNDSATTGFVGEKVSSYVNGTSVGANATFYDITSISLTAGDWDVGFTIQYRPGTGVFSAGQMLFEGGISTASGTGVTGMSTGENYVFLDYPDSTTFDTGVYLSIAPTRITIASTTTYYLKGYISTYTSGTPTQHAQIFARRVR